MTKLIGSSIVLLLASVASAAFSTATGYSATELYTTSGSFTTIGGLDFDAGELYFGQSTNIKLLDLAEANTPVNAGTIPSNVGNSLVVRHGGVTYTSFGVSFAHPYPYRMGYIDANGDYYNQWDADGIYDAAVNSSGVCYVVANPDANGSRIFRYNFPDGNAAEIANVGGYSGGLAFDSQDNLYYAEQTTGEILKFTAAEVASAGDGNVLVISDADVALSIMAGYLDFDDDDYLYATTGYGAVLSKYDLASKSKVRDVAYGGIGQFGWEAETLYLVDTDWGAFASTIQRVVPEPAAIWLIAGGLILLRRRRHGRLLRVD